MGKELELYKAFIDGLVEQKDSVTAKWVLEGGFPHTEDNQAKNKFLSSLTLAQKVCWQRCFRKNILLESMIRWRISMK